MTSNLILDAYNKFIRDKAKRPAIVYLSEDGIRWFKDYYSKPLALRARFNDAEVKLDPNLKGDEVRVE